MGAPETYALFECKFYLPSWLLNCEPMNPLEATAKELTLQQAHLSPLSEDCQLSATPRIMNVPVYISSGIAVLFSILANKT